MKTVSIEYNGHDLRKGFQTITYANNEEHKQHNIDANYKADLARKRRLRAKSGKPRMSTILIHTKIPQIFDKFIMPRAKKACALGALHLEATALYNKGKSWGKDGYCSDEPDWWKMEREFDVLDEELLRVVKCPKCFFPNTNSLASQIHHLNDQHKMENKYIGKWLKKWDL